MEEERNWGNEFAGSGEPDLTQSNEIYNNINKLNDKLDEIAGLHKIDVDSKETMVNDYSNQSFDVPFKLDDNYQNENITKLDSSNDLDLESDIPSDFDYNMSIIPEETSNSDFNITEPVLPTNNELSNIEISNEISNIESNNEVTNAPSGIDSINEISMPSVSDKEVSEDLETKKEGKGQYILITILTIILISLLLLMVYFTSSL